MGESGGLCVKGQQLLDAMENRVGMWPKQELRFPQVIVVLQGASESVLVLQGGSNTERPACDRAAAGVAPHFLEGSR